MLRQCPPPPRSPRRVARGSGEVSAALVPRADARPQLAACQNHLRLLEPFQLPRAGPGRAGLEGPPGTPTAAGAAGGVSGAAVLGPGVRDPAFQEQICDEPGPRAGGGSRG